MHSNWVSTTSIMPSQPRPQPPSASVTASSTFTPSMWDEERKVALLKLARVHNLVPSILLVFLGAWVGGFGGTYVVVACMYMHHHHHHSQAGTGRTFACFGSALASLSVWVMSLVSGGVAIASVIVNDYFDWSSGIDQQNSPDKVCWVSIVLHVRIYTHTPHTITRSRCPVASSNQTSRSCSLYHCMQVCSSLHAYWNHVQCVLL